MGAGNWNLQHWFDFFETIGIVGSLLLGSYNARKDEQARKIGNAIAINEQYLQIWGKFYERPQLSRVLAKTVDLAKEPVSPEEELFVTMLILHLGTVYRAMRHGEFVKFEGLQRDVREFFSLPIPRAVWRKAKPLQNRDFAAFVEATLK